MSEAAPGTLLQRIRSQMRTFTAAEKKFARYVLSTEDLIYRSITAATEESGSGYGTVIRFCQRMGFSGYQDFKINLALERRQPAAGDSAGAKGWLMKAAERAGEQLRATAAEVDEKRLAAAAKALLKARRLLVIGVAGSYPSALELSYRLSRLGIAAATEADTHMQSIRASTLAEKDVLVAISFTGATSEILTAVSLAREAGAVVVALTNSPRSPLAEAASLVLCTARWEDMTDEEIGSRLPVHFLVESLCERVFKDHAGAADALKRTADSVEDRLTWRA